MEVADKPDQSDFQEITTWIFDLDNTLYPRHSNLFAQVDVKIREYVSRLLEIPFEEAQKVQKAYYRDYGTTLRGLMLEHAIDPDDFLNYVHDIDHSPVQPDPALGEAISKLAGRRYIFTNGSRTHAINVAERLGITEHFEDIFDIVWADLLPKPNRLPYEKLVAETGIDPAKSAMFEDLARNLEVPHDLGMRTVLVVPQGTRDVFHEEWEAHGRDEPHVDHVTDDLAGFVAEIVR